MPRSCPVHAPFITVSLRSISSQPSVNPALKPEPDPSQDFRCNCQRTARISIKSVIVVGNTVIRILNICENMITFVYLINELCQLPLSTENSMSMKKLIIGLALITGSAFDTDAQENKKTVHVLSGKQQKK